MEWKFDDSRPIWPQIKDIITTEIISGNYKSGEAFPTVRSLAEDASVNRNTMQRALSELENEGLIITNRTVGRTVTTDIYLLEDTKEKMAKQKVGIFLAEMNSLGYSKSDILTIMESKGDINE